jgi:hypothetical protein
MSSIPNASTGPRTAEGKARSSMNALKHGLASSQLIIEGEILADFESLEASLLEEHAPATPTEALLVKEMAKSYWLKDRAIRFQAVAFNITAPHLHKMAAPMDLGVLIRYQSAHERAFYRALKTLQTIQKERKSAPKQFVSQTRPTDPDKLIVALAIEMDDVTKQLTEFMKKHPNHPGFVKSVAPNGAVSFRSAR